MTEAQLKRKVKSRITQLKKVNYPALGEKIVSNRKVQMAAGILAVGLIARIIYARTHRSAVDKFLSKIS